MSIIAQFLRHPLRTGAVAASSARLARAMTEDIGIETASLIVELGPGTGAITDAILPRMGPKARLVLVELNPALAARMAARYPDPRVQVVQGSAADLVELVAPGTVDVVVSGLPWTVMPGAVQGRILRAVDEVLRPDGRFTTFAYLHAARTPLARQFLEQLAGQFGSQERGATVWSNLPPARVLRAAQPRARQTPLDIGSGGSGSKRQ
ncbi:MAG TPA: methyltransferase domain-containing protein [Pseudonocardia sp.]|nr:methyltransferase domain-containing protein [Pseudonocardia sp.]